VHQNTRGSSILDCSSILHYSWSGPLKAIQFAATNIDTIFDEFSSILIHFLKIYDIPQQRKN